MTVVGKAEIIDLQLSDEACILLIKFSNKNF
jgi:hypothetical protein